MENRAYRYFIAFVFVLCAIASTKAQVGTTDTSFFRGMGVVGVVNAGVELSDSGVVIGGGFTYVNQTQANRLVKLKANGQVDNSFNVGTGLNNIVTRIVKQPDGKLLVGGLFSQYKGVITNALMRVGADGSKDSGFTPSIYGQVTDILLQQDSFILIVGSFTNVNGSAINRVTRLKHNGTRDSTFNVGSGANGNVNSISRQSDGKYIIAGEFSTFNGITANKIARLNINGSLDTTFSVGSGPNSGVSVIRVLANDKMLFSGPFITAFNGGTNYRLTCLTKDGALDTIFNSGSGINMNSSASEILQQNNGKIIVVGGFGSYNGTAVYGIMRIDTLGRVDTSFYTGSGTGNSCNTVFPSITGGYFLGGNFSGYNGYARYGVAKIKADASIDHNFMRDTKFNGLINMVDAQSSGKLIVCGDFTRYNDITVKYVARLNLDGTLDTTFNYGNAGANSGLGAVKVASDDKIYIGGNITNYNGNTVSRFARLKSNGTYDSTFVMGNGFSCCGINAIKILNDTTIYVAGNFGSYKSSAVSKVARIFTNGNRDNTFNPPNFNVGNAGVTDIDIQADGKVIAVGDYVYVNGPIHFSLIRLNTNGSIDSTYRNGNGLTGQTTLTSVMMQGNKALITHGGVNVDGLARHRICKINTDGTLDLTYNVDNTSFPTNGSGIYLSDACQLNNGILTVGNCPTKYSSRASGVAFLDNVGQMDTFNYLGSGISTYGDVINGLFKDDRNGRIYLHGNIHYINGHLANGMIAVKNYVENPVVSGPICRGGTGTVYFDKRLTFGGGNTFTVQLSDSLGGFASPVSIGTVSRGGWGPDSVQVAVPMYKGNGTGYKVRVVSTDPAFTGAGSNPFVVGPIAAPVVTGDSTFCHGDSIQLSSSPAGSYAWSTGDTTRNIWVDTPGTYMVSVTSGNCTAASIGKQVTERTLQPPAAPAAMTGCSDSTYTFVFDSIYAGSGGNQVQWSYGSTFGTAQTVASGGTITLPDLATDTTIWIRSRDSISGCVSAGVSTKARIRPLPTNNTLSALAPQVYAGMGTYIRIAGSQPGTYYQPLKGTLPLGGGYGNGDTVHVGTGGIDAPARYTVVATDSNGCSRLMQDTVGIDTVPMAGMAWYRYRNTAQDGTALQGSGNTTMSAPFRNHALGLNSSTKATGGMYVFRFSNGHSFEGMVGLVPDLANPGKGLRVLVQHGATGMAVGKGVYLIDSSDIYYYLGGIDDTSALDIKIQKTGRGFRIYKDNAYSGYYPMDTSLVLYPFAAPFTAGSVLASAKTDIGAPLLVEASVENVSCGTGTGSATAHVYGGVPPYHYSWSNGDTSAVAAGLGYGSHTVTVTDAASASMSLAASLAYATGWDTLVNAELDTAGGLRAIDPQGAFHSYATATNTLPGGTAGWVEWEIAEGDTFQGAFFMMNNAHADETTDGMSVVISGNMVLADGTGLDGASYVGSYEQGKGYRFRIAVSDSGFTIYKSVGNAAPSSFFVPVGTAYDMFPGATPFTAGSRLASMYMSFGCGKLRAGTKVAYAATATDMATVQADAKGGTPPYSYAWSNGAATASITAIPGTYTVTVTDAGAQSATARAFAGAYVAWHKLANMVEGTDRSLVATSNGDMEASHLINHAFGQNALLPDQAGSIQYDFASGTDFCGVVGLSNDYVGADGTKGLGALLVQERLGIEGMDAGVYYLDGEGELGYLGQLRENVALSIGFERHGDTVDIIKNGMGRTSVVIPTPYNLHPIVGPLFAGDRLGRATADFGVPLQLEHKARHTTCAGNAPGSITVQVFGGTPPYTYSWSNGGTASSADSLAVGIYTLTVQDSGSDTLVKSFEIGYATEWDTLVKLAMDTDGQLAIQGTAQVTAFDNYGFGLNSVAPGENSWIEFLLPGGPAFTGALGLAENMRYDESSLGLAFNIAGGGIYVNVNGQYTQHLCDYMPGTPYRLRIGLAGDSAHMYVTDEHGYNAGTSETVYCPRTTYLSPLVAVGQATARIAAVNTGFGCGRMHAELRTEPAGKNGSTGNIHAYIKGGTPPYSYHWSNGASTASLVGAAIGNYILTVTDQAADTVIESVFLGRFVDWDLMANMYEDTAHRVICTGDTLDPILGVSNYALARNTLAPGEHGTALFEFAKSLQYAGNIGLGQPGKFMSATGFYALVLPDGYYGGLEQGLYVVGDDGIQYFGKLRDSLPLAVGFTRGPSGITVTKNGRGSILLPYPDTIALAPLAAPGWNGNTITRATCDFGKRLQADPVVAHLGCGETNTGSIDMNASGGTPPYTYSWADGGTAATRDSLAAGSYAATVTDAAGATAVRSVTVAWQAAWDTLDGFIEDSTHSITSLQAYAAARSASVLPVGMDGWFEFGIQPGRAFSGIFSLADHANPGDAAEGFGIYIGSGNIFFLHKENQAGDFIGNYTEGQGHRFRMHASGNTLTVTKQDYHGLLAPVEYIYTMERTLCLAPGVMVMGPGYCAAPITASFGCGESGDTTIAAGVLSASADTICAGGGATLVLSAYSGTIRWQKKNSTDNFWTDIDTLVSPGRDTITLSRINTAVAFRAVLSGSGCGKGISPEVSITVRENTAGNNRIIAENGMCLEGDTVIVRSALQIGAGYTYQWLSSSDGNLYVPVNGAQGESYVFETGTVAGYLRREAAQAGKCPNSSNTVKIKP